MRSFQGRLLRTGYYGMTRNSRPLVSGTERLVIAQLSMLHSQRLSRAHAPPQAVPPARAGTKIKSVKISPRSGTGATKWYWPPKATGCSRPLSVLLPLSSHHPLPLIHPSALRSGSRIGVRDDIMGALRDDGIGVRDDIMGALRDDGIGVISG